MPVGVGGVEVGVCLGGGPSGKPDQCRSVVQLLGSDSRNYKLTIKRVWGLCRLQGRTGSMWCVPTVLSVAT